MSVGPGMIERACGRIAGRLLVIAGRRAIARGDRHEFDHIRAAIELGNTAGTSHDHGCLAREVLGDRAMSKEDQ